MVKSICLLRTQALLGVILETLPENKHNNIYLPKLRKKFNFFNKANNFTTHFRSLPRLTHPFANELNLIYLVFILFYN